MQIGYKIDQDNQEHADMEEVDGNSSNSPNDSQRTQQDKNTNSFALAPGLVDTNEPINYGTWTGAELYWVGS